MKKIVKIGGVILTVGVIGVLCVGVFVPRYQALAELEKQRNQLRDAKMLMETDIAEFKDMQVMFETDPTFVVLTARKENYMHPREIVFIFPKD